MILTVTLNASIDKRYVVSGARLGAVNRVTSCTYTPGGKGLNVSKPAAIAGARVIATGFVGGHAGNYIEESLKEFGIESAFCHVQGESRSCINIWDEALHQQTEYLEPGCPVTQDDFLRFLDIFREMLPSASVICVSGSVPKGLDASAYRKIIQITKEAGKKIIFDSSGALLSQGIEEKPTMIKPNIDEIRMLTGLPCNDLDEILTAGKEIHKKGIEIVAVSIGSEGSIVISDEGCYRAMVPKIDAVNTVGCGDSMIAGFALGLSENLSIKETLRKASAISAASALREETGFFRMEDMQKIYPQIVINEL